MKELINQNYQFKTEDSLGCFNISPFLEISGKSDVLDLGCGNGGFVYKLAADHPDIRFYGIDLTDKMIEKALRVNHRDNIRYIQGDILRMPYKNDAFDLIYSNCVINHVVNKSDVFQEIYRVLRPDGEMIIADAISVNPLPDEIRNDPLQIAQCFGGAVTGIEYLKSIASAGFKNISILNRRSYMKLGFPFESLIIKGEK